MPLVLAIDAHSLLHIFRDIGSHRLTCSKACARQQISLASATKEGAWDFGRAGGAVDGGSTELISKNRSSDGLQPASVLAPSSDARSP